MFLECQDKVMATGPYTSVNGQQWLSETCPAGNGRQIVVTSLVAENSSGQHRMSVSHAHLQPPQQGPSDKP